MHEGFARALAWHLHPFRRATPETHAFAVDMYVAQRDEGSDPPLYSLYVANELHYRGPGVAEVLAHAVWDLHQLVTKKARDFVFLHAGAVARDHGALVLPAAMDSGKSSLVTALLEAGWDYLSDELGSVDPVTTRIYPFPKLISLDEDALAFFPGLADKLSDRDATPLPERFVTPDAVGADVGGAAPARWIVFPTADFTGEPRLEDVPRSEAVVRMAQNCMNLYRYGDRGVVLLTRVADGATAYELRGGTPRERAALLTRELA